MTEQLEAQVKAALSRRASAVGADAVERVRHGDYRPRMRRLPGRPGMIGLAGMGATGAGVAIAVVLTGATPAFAGWTSAPRQASAAETAGASSTCETELPPTPGGDPGGWTPVVTDVRGPFTLVVFEDGAASATCLTGPDVTSVSSSAGWSMSASAVGVSGVQAGQGASSASSLAYPAGSGIEQLSQAHLDSTGQGAYTVVDGQVASDVTGVTLDEDGTDVETTTADGWLVAWWPGDAEATSAAITTPSGTTTQSLTDGAPDLGRAALARRHRA